MFKKFLSVMLLAVAITFVTAQENTAEARYQVVGIRTYLSIREYPSVNSRELARIPNGTILDTYDSQRGWDVGFVPVIYRGIWGYAAERYLMWIN